MANLPHEYLPEKGQGVKAEREISLMTEKIKMYGHPACPTVPPMRGMLNRTGVEYDYINIYQNEIARELVRSINHGNESVPTFVFPDGSSLTEPSPLQMQKKLESLNYHIPLSAKLIGYASLLPSLLVFLVVLWYVFS